MRTVEGKENDLNQVEPTERMHATNIETHWHAKRAQCIK